MFVNGKSCFCFCQLFFWKSINIFVSSATFQTGFQETWINFCLINLTTTYFEIFWTQSSKRGRKFLFNFCWNKQRMKFNVNSIFLDCTYWVGHRVRFLSLFWPLLKHLWFFRHLGLEYKTKPPLVNLTKFKLFKTVKSSGNCLLLFPMELIFKI